jgi:hopene-associated glycosyltransferase HpnB
MLIFSLSGVAALAAWVYLAFAHGCFWKPLLPERGDALASFPSVDIVVPARNEADVLPQTLPSLLAQDYAGAWHIILVDDHSNDGTGDIARNIAANLGKASHLSVVSAPDLREGWSGKVSAMNEGAQRSHADFILFADADIRHPIHSLKELAARITDKKLDLVSRMVKLNCESFAEKFLIPAFVFFFELLYPFRRAGNPKSRTAAAAGGAMLVRKAMLDKIGGLARIKSALIDDCSLAKAIKGAGGKIELTLANNIESLRSYPHISDVWRMIARTAYTQLRHSPFLLVGTVIGLAFLFLLPLLLFLFAPTLTALLAGFFACVLTAALYAPMVKFYHLQWVWALTLPAAAFIYAAATIDSAILYHQGKGGQWKGRAHS